MRLYVLLAMAVAMAHANPKPVRPSAGRGEVKVDSYLYRPDGQGVGSRGMAGRMKSFSLMQGYDVEESNGEEGNVGQQYADQLRAGAVAAAAEANLGASGFHLGQTMGFSAPLAPAGGISQAGRGLSIGVGNAVAAGGAGLGHIGGVLGPNCPEGHAFALGGGNAQGSNAANFAHGVEVAGYEGGFTSSFGIGEHGYQLNGLGQASSVAAGSRNEGGLSLGAEVGHSGLHGFLAGGVGGQAAAAPAHSQAQGAYQNVLSQGIAAGQAVLGSGKLATQLGGGGRAGMEIGASSAAAYGGSQVADGYSRYAVNADYSGQGRYIGQGVEERYMSSLANGFAAGNGQGALLAGNSAAYDGHDGGAQINAYMAGQGHEGGVRYAGLASNIALGGAGFSGGEGGLSLGIRGYSEGAGSSNGGAGSGAGFGYQQGLNSGSYLGHGSILQSSLGAGGNAGHVAYGGIQVATASKANGGQSSQNFNLGYGGHGEGSGSSVQGRVVQGGYSGASSSGASTEGSLGGGEQAGYGAGLASNSVSGGGYYSQHLAGFQGGRGGERVEESNSAGLGIGGQANYGFAGAGSALLAQGGGESKQYIGFGGEEGRLEGQGQQESYAGLGGSAAGGGGISSVSFNSGAAENSGENFRVGSYSSGYSNQGQEGVTAGGGQGQYYASGAQEGHGIESGGSASFVSVGENQGGHSGAFGASGSGQLFGSGGFGGHSGSGGAIGISYGGQIGGGNLHSGGSASSFSIGGGNIGSGGHIAQAGGGASADFSGVRYASGSGHATSFAAQSATHAHGSGSAVKHLVVEEGHEDHYYGHPKYHFEYAVNDPHTGDIKNQWESRDGDVVKGAYSLHEPDGTIRTVEYESDKESGFHAVVKKSGKALHPTAH